jgi:hypothetical protein
LVPRLVTCFNLQLAGSVTHATNWQQQATTNYSFDLM